MNRNSRHRVAPTTHRLGTCLLAVACCLTPGAMATGAGSTATQPAGIHQGVACYRQTAVDDRDETGQTLHLEFDEPIVAAAATKPEGWGYFQFPGLNRWEDGRLSLGWHMAADSAKAYGAVPGRAVSTDDGKTWAPYTGPSGVSGLLLPNGDRIVVVTPKSRKLSELKLPEPAGFAVSSYTKERLPLYRLSELPADLGAVYIKRLPRGEKTWITERARLDDACALRYSTEGVFPVVWWGDVRIAPDGSLLAGIYPGYRVRDNGTVDTTCHVFFYRSTDAGRSWQIQGRILYEPDLNADPKGNLRNGFSEPAFTILPGGQCLCVMRTTDGAGIGPLYASRSTDLGKTWSPPRVIAPSGVLPRLLQLGNGVLVLSSGRPGVQVRFCRDGRGEIWSNAFEMLPCKGHHDSISCGYTTLLATGPDRFLLAYSDFKHINATGQPLKAIKVRQITVSK